MVMLDKKIREILQCRNHQGGSSPVALRLQDWRGLSRSRAGRASECCRGVCGGLEELETEHERNK